MHRSTIVAGSILLASVTTAFIWIGTLKLDSDGSLYRWTSAKSDLDILNNAVTMSARERGHLPSDAEGLDSLVDGDHGFLGRVPQDPWHHPYVYRRTKEPPGFEIHSVGQNGRDESGDGDDVVVTDKSYRCEDYTVGCVFTFDRVVLLSLTLLIVSSVMVLLYRGARAGVRSRRVSGQWLALLPCGPASGSNARAGEVTAFSPSAWVRSEQYTRPSSAPPA